MAKKNNWDKIQAQRNEDNARFRDVYDDQQFDRSRLGERQTMASRAWIAIVVGVLVAFLFWLMMAGIEYAAGDMAINSAWNDFMFGGNAEKSKYQYVTIREVQNVYAEDGVTPVLDEEGKPKVTYIHTRYILNRETNILTDVQNGIMPVYTGAKPYVFDAEKQKWVPFELPEDYDFEANLPKDENGEAIIPRMYLKFNAPELKESEYYIGTTHMNTDGDVYLDNVVETYIDYNHTYGDADDIKIENKSLDAQYIANYGFILGANINSRYRMYYGELFQRDAGFMAQDRMFDMRPTPLKLLVSLITGLITFAILWAVLKKNLDALNIEFETGDINQHYNDQHIALPEEVQRLYDVFPDVGAHSSVMVSSMISHQMLTNKGLKKVKLARRAKENIKDEDGDVVVYKGDILRDENGEPLYDEVPIIDNEFSEALFDSSKTPKDKYARKYYDAPNIPYNPGNENLDKLKNYDTVAEVINKDWEFPIYEPQRPGGMYIVDTAPVNTMVLAITRAGKGQTIIEPTIDMWTREIRPNNMVINDPKGELLVKNYVRGTTRGFTIVQFNLINPMKTDIYNPLSLAAEAARDGNSTKCAMYVENIAEVFFPVDGGEDPLWPNAANNAFKRAAYGMIDFYLEEEKEMRRFAAVKNIDKKVLELKIDEMWGRVTLYNCYQLFVQLSSKKQKDPVHVTTDKIEAAKEDGHPYSDDEVEEMAAEALEQNPIWNDAKEADMLTLYFNATAKLPKNSMRTLVTNADNALKAMGGAEKMISSVYGIAITAMSFFTDPTISTLTSGTIAQNVDLAGLSFPRRFGVRFHMDYLKEQHLVGMQCLWDAYEDDKFEKNLGKDFEHEDTVSREGWARYFFKGCFKNEKAYIRLRIKDVASDMLVKTFYFEFVKDYQTSYDGKSYMKDPVLGTKIVKNGFLTEMIKVRKKDGTIVFKKYPSTFEKDTVTNVIEVAKQLEELSEDEKKEKRQELIKRSMVKTNIFNSLSAKYQEKCKMVFLVTPPHLMKYAKLILILIKQLVDLNFDQSYMTKSNQKPLYKTRFMLDELGNLQSEGHGISGFETMLSIGLGQEQQFTLILQTLQQLKDVYGDSVDKIVQGNTSNIVFLKSTDDSMIETLSKMSGVRHRVYKEGKTITKNVSAMTSFSKNEDKVSYNMSVKEEPVISYNDMASIPPCNSIVFRAGDSPIWNRNETALPMSWRLFKNTIINPGKEYTLQTIPTLSTAKDFDVKQNQPNFMKMFEKRLKQAAKAEKAMEYYQSVYGYTDDEINRLDVDVYADDIMELISTMMHPDLDLTVREENVDVKDIEEATEVEQTEITKTAVKNNDVEQALATDPMIQRAKNGDKKIYANGMISRNDLYTQYGANHALDSTISDIYHRCRNFFSQDSTYFRVDPATNNLTALDGTIYIYGQNNTKMAQQMQEASEDPNSRVMSEGEIDAKNDYVITDAFYKFLVSFDTEWPFTRGEFAKQMSRAQIGKE